MENAPLSCLSICIKLPAVSLYAHRYHFLKIAIFMIKTIIVGWLLIGCKYACCQVGLKYDNHLSSFKMLHSRIFFYNDSVAFYSETIETRTNISILNWYKKDSIIYCKAFEDGRQMAIKKIEKIELHDAKPKIIVLDMDGDTVGHNYFLVKELKKGWDVKRYLGTSSMKICTDI